MTKTIVLLALFIICAGSMVLPAQTASGALARPAVDSDFKASVTDAMRATETCESLDGQIVIAQALEDYAKARYEAHSEGDDLWACKHAENFYNDVCNARRNAEYLNRYLCDRYSGSPGLCSDTSGC